MAAWRERWFHELLDAVIQHEEIHSEDHPCLKAILDGVPEDEQLQSRAYMEGWRDASPD